MSALAIAGTSSMATHEVNSTEESKLLDSAQSTCPIFPGPYKEQMALPMALAEKLACLSHAHGRKKGGHPNSLLSSIDPAYLCRQGT